MARATFGESARPDWSIAGLNEIFNARQFSKLAATSKKYRKIRT